jgi:hypothetical protein
VLFLLADVAQSVERQTFNLAVAGSSPAVGGPLFAKLNGWGEFPCNMCRVDGLVAEYLVANEVTRVRFPVDAQRQISQFEELS